MKTAILLFLAFLISVDAGYSQDEKPEVSLYDHLLSDFKKSKVREDGSKLLSFQSYTVLHEGFDAEIFEKLRELYPKELKAALSSSGNMHNPKVIPLRKPFNIAFLRTGTVLKLSESLNKEGYEITKASHEKLSIDKSGGSLRMKIVAWLICEPTKAEQG